jgi:hypothetical protein
MQYASFLIDEDLPLGVLPMKDKLTSCWCRRNWRARRRGPLPAAERSAERGDRTAAGGVRGRGDQQGGGSAALRVESLRRRGAEAWDMAIPREQS